MILSTMFLFLCPNLSSVSFSDLQTDKASMLDEAIEYLKTLQLQVQVDVLNCNGVNNKSK